MEQTIVTKIIGVTCCNCGLLFGLNEEHWQRLNDNGKKFCCPNGHIQYFTKKEDLEAKLKKKEEEVESLECRISICESASIRDFTSHSRQDYYLEWGGINTIGDALKLGESGLLDIHGVGKKTIEAINYWLEEYNIRLKP